MAPCLKLEVAVRALPQVSRQLGHGVSIKRSVQIGGEARPSLLAGLGQLPGHNHNLLHTAHDDTQPSLAVMLVRARRLFCSVIGLWIAPFGELSRSASRRAARPRISRLFTVPTLVCRISAISS